MFALSNMILTANLRQYLFTSYMFSISSRTVCDEFTRVQHPQEAAAAWPAGSRSKCLYMQAAHSFFLCASSLWAVIALKAAVWASPPMQAAR